jgi:hypothetical protein
MDSLIELGRTWCAPQPLFLAKIQVCRFRYCVCEFRYALFSHLAAKGILEPRHHSNEMFPQAIL